MRIRSALALTIALSACKAPPIAPEGLDASAAFMVRNFYADDATFQAGIQGYLEWFENGGGRELVGLAPSSEKPVTAFEVGTLTAEDLAPLPLSEEIVLDPGDPDDTSDDEIGPRDPAKAIGVVSLEQMACSWQEAEQLLVLPEQDAVFSGDWEAYERVYISSREAFEAARESEEFATVGEAITPHEEGFALADYAGTLLFTDNSADPSPEPLVGNLPAFPLRLEMRHGVFETDVYDDPVGVLVILTYAPEAFWGEQGKNGFRQSYSIELNVEQSGDETLRLLAIWNEPEILGIDPDSNIAKTTAVNKSRRSSATMREVCEGGKDLDL